jgi:hypothetical protein
MITKFSVLALILLLAVGVLSIKSSSTKASRAAQAAAEPGTLDWYAQRAQAQGAEGYNFSAGEVEYNQPGTWDDVLASFSFVKVQLVTSKSYPTLGNHSIETWYKFRVLDTLASKPVLTCDGCPSFPTAPADMLPLQTNEILVPKLGGTLTYGGVTLTAKEPVFPDFLSSQNYLLILQLNPSTQVGHINMGPTGAYTVDSSNIMRAINPSIDDYHNDLTNRYGNSLTQLRMALNPGTCDPVKEQNCYNSSGEWNPSNCSCYVDPCIRRPWLCGDRSGL